MSENGLTEEEQAFFLAIKDLHKEQRDDEFYDALLKIKYPSLFDLKPGIRKAIAEFVPLFTALIRLRCAGVDEEMVALTVNYLLIMKGYELGWKLRAPLTMGDDKTKKEGKVEIIDISKVKRAAQGGYWFTPGALKFFRSRYAGTAKLQGGKAYFVSSERFSDETPRLYSVRVCNMATGDIDTVGEFQQYRTSKEAEGAIDKLLEL